MKILKSTATVIISFLIIFTVVVAGDIISPSGTPEAQFYTLSEIYEFIDNNTTATEGAHDFTFSDALAGTSHTLTEIYDKLKNLIDSSKVLSGTTYLGVDGSATAGTDYSLQKYVRYDDWYDSGSTDGEYVGEEASWTHIVDDSAVGDTIQDGGDAVCTDVTSAAETDCARLVSKHVYRDEYTGLEWTDISNKIIDNDFTWVVGENAETTTIACNFLASGDPNSYCDSPGDDDLSATDFCLKLSLDNGSGVKTDWRLPSKKELLQAYINGAANNLPNIDLIIIRSSTESSADPSRDWSVYLQSGKLYTYSKSTNSTIPLYARCVRP